MLEDYLAMFGAFNEGTRAFRAADGTVTASGGGRGPKVRATRAIVLAIHSSTNHDVALQTRQEASRACVVGLEASL